MPDGADLLTIREVGTDEGLRLLVPHLGAHFEEVAKFKHLFEVEPNMAYYREMEAKNRLVALVAESQGIMVGYSVTFLTENVHYKKTLVAQNDLLYVVPEKRKGRYGLFLMRETVTRCKERGASVMVWHAKLGTTLNEMLPRMGYETLDVLWAKEI